MAANLRGTPGNDTLVIATADTTYLGGAGDDTYIIDQSRVQQGDTISINDTQGANRIQLVGGMEIVSSEVATLESGVSQLFLTLSNGTNVLVNGASSFGFDVGGSFGGEGATTQSFEQLVQTLGYAAVPAPGEPAEVDAPVVIDGEPPEPPRPEDEFTVEEAIADGDALPAEYVIRDTAGNILGNLDLPIVSEAEMVELSAPASVAQAGSLLEVPNFTGEYALRDSLAKMEAAPGVYIGATAHTLTNDPGDLGTLNAEQAAIVDGATNANDYTFTPSEPQPSDDETFTLTQQADFIAPDAEDPADRPSDEDTLFRAPVTQNETGSGELANTFETGDVLDGAGGTNTLRADLIATGTVSDGSFFAGGAAISATTNNVRDVYLRAQTPQADLSNNTTPGSTIDAENMNGVREWWTDNSRSHVQIEDIRTDPETTTFGMTETDPDVGYRAYFNPRALDGVINDSLLTIQIAELDGGVIDTGAQLENIRVEALRFTLNGEEETLRSDEMAEANTWLALRDAIIDELATKGLDTIEVDLLSEGQYRLFDTQGGSFSDQGGFTATADTDRQIDIRNRVEQDSLDGDPTESTAILNAVGNGSQGGGLDIGVMSGNRGIEILNLEVTNQDSHLTQVVSNTARSDNPNTLPPDFPQQNDFLERVNITPHEAGDQGDLTVRDTVNPNATSGLWDVQTVDARVDGQVFTGFLDLDITLNGFERDLIQDYFQRLEDGETADFDYQGGDGGNRLSFDVDTQVAGDPDFRMAINGGIGDDHIIIRNNGFVLQNVSIDADPRDVNPDSENTLETFANINTNPASTPAEIENLQTLVLRDNEGTIPAPPPAGNTTGSGNGPGVNANLSGKLAGVENLVIATGGDSTNPTIDSYTGGDTTITALQPNQSVSISGENQIGDDINGGQGFGRINFRDAQVNTLAVALDNAARVDAWMTINALNVTGNNSNVGTLELHSNGGRDTWNSVQSINAAEVTTLSLHGTQNLTVTVNDLATQPVDIDGNTPSLSINGSALEGTLNLGFNANLNRQGTDDQLVGTDNANDRLWLQGSANGGIFNASVSDFEFVAFHAGFQGTYDAASDTGIQEYEIWNTSGPLFLNNLGNDSNVDLFANVDPSGVLSLQGPIRLQSSGDQGLVNINVHNPDNFDATTSPIEIYEYRTINIDVMDQWSAGPGPLALDLRFDPAIFRPTETIDTTARVLNVDADKGVDLSTSTFVSGMRITTGSGSDEIDMSTENLTVNAGGGSDTFVYSSVANSPDDKRDTIEGFQAKPDVNGNFDKLDISALVTNGNFNGFVLLDGAEENAGDLQRVYGEQWKDWADANGFQGAATPVDTWATPEQQTEEKGVLFAIYDATQGILFFDANGNGDIGTADDETGDVLIRMPGLGRDDLTAENFGDAPQPQEREGVFTVGGVLGMIAAGEPVPAEYDILDDVNDMLDANGQFVSAEVEGIINDAGNVEVTTPANVAQASTLLNLVNDNFDGDYDLTDLLANLAAEDAQAIRDGAGEYQLTDENSDLGEIPEAWVPIVEDATNADQYQWVVEPEPTDTEIVPVDLVWEDGSINQNLDADDYRDIAEGIEFVTFNMNAEPNNGDMWAVAVSIDNFTAGDELNLTNLNLGNPLSISGDLSGYNADEQALDIGLQVGNSTLPAVIFTLENTDAAALGLDVTDGGTLVASLESADWLVI